MKVKLLSLITVLGIIGVFLFLNQTPKASAQIITIVPSPTITQTPTGTIAATIIPCVIGFPTGHAQVSLSYSVASDAAYNVWSRIQGSGSGWVQVDSQCPILLGNTADWTWVNYQRDDATKKVAYPLTAGQHTIKYAVESGNFNVDRVILVDDANCIPTGFGANCDGSPIGPGNPGGPTYTCLGSCPTLTPTPTASLVIIPGGGPAPCGSTGGGGGFLDFLELIFKLLQLLFGFGGGNTGCPTTPAPAPTATPSASLAPTQTPAASPTATLEPTVAPTDLPTAMPTEAPTQTPMPTLEPTASPTATLIPTVITSPVPTDPCHQSAIHGRGEQRQRRNFFSALFDFILRLIEFIWRTQPAPQQPAPEPTDIPAPSVEQPTTTTVPGEPTSTPNPCLNPTGTVAPSSVVPSTILSPTVFVTQIP